MARIDVPLSRFDASQPAERRAMSHPGQLPGRRAPDRCDDRCVPVARPAAALLGSALLAVLVAGCSAAASPPTPAPAATQHLGGQPTPDVTGVVAGGAITEASDPYYEGMALASAGDGPSVLAADGSQSTVADLHDGDAIELWLVPGSGCAESYPVQCQVLTVRVTEAATATAPSPAPTATATTAG
jgi:hypothetical protein